MIDKNYINWKNWSIDSFGRFSKLEKVYFDNIIKILKLNSAPKVLEIGFGNGAFLGYSAKQSFMYDGVESNKKLVDLARSKGYSSFHSIDEIDSNSKYDLIVLFDVLEHIHEDGIEEFFKKLNQFLNKDGSIFLRFPNGSSPLGLGNQHGDLTHCNIVTLPKLNYWCLKSELKIVFYRGDIRPFIFKHNFLKMPLRLLKLVLFTITEKYVRTISNQSKGVLSSNLEVVLKKF
jgi:2-polyprenyl-3-methyl-5-hydroxy-6-metoxy-1,4-benzoquinol methylase